MFIQVDKVTRFDFPRLDRKEWQSAAQESLRSLRITRNKKGWHEGVETFRCLVDKV